MVLDYLFVIHSNLVKNNSEFVFQSDFKQGKL